MRKLLLAMCITVMVPVAYAQWTAPGTTEPPTAPAPTSDKSAEKNALTTQPNGEVKQLLGYRNCVSETGSNIVRKDKCVNATGQAYGGTAIERTGTYDTGTALERLSPAVTIRGGVH